MMKTILFIFLAVVSSSIWGQTPDDSNPLPPARSTLPFVFGYNWSKITNCFLESSIKSYQDDYPAGLRSSFNEFTASYALVKIPKYNLQIGMNYTHGYVVLMDYYKEKKPSIYYTNTDSKTDMLANPVDYELNLDYVGFHLENNFLLQKNKRINQGLGIVFNMMLSFDDPQEYKNPNASNSEFGSTVGFSNYSNYQQNFYTDQYYERNHVQIMLHPSMYYSIGVNYQITTRILRTMDTRLKIGYNLRYNILEDEKIYLPSFGLFSFGGEFAIGRRRKKGSYSLNEFQFESEYE